MAIAGASGRAQRRYRIPYLLAIKEFAVIIGLFNAVVYTIEEALVNTLLTLETRLDATA